MDRPHCLICSSNNNCTAVEPFTLPADALSGGTIHVIFEPVDFIAELAALVPNPRVKLTHYHNVFASSYF